MPSKFDHLGVPLPKDQFEAIVQWYLTALAPLNYAEVMRFPGVVGLGVEGNPDLWFQAKDDYTEGSKLHIAFHAPGEQSYHIPADPPFHRNWKGD